MEGAHLAFLSLALLTMVIADHEGLVWMRGKKELLNPERLQRLHIMAWTALGGLIASGTIMVYPYYHFYLTDPVFLFKMFFVGLLLANSFVIHKLMPVATKRPFSTLSKRERLPLFLSGAVSLLAWSSAAIIGFLFL